MSLKIEVYEWTSPVNAHPEVEFQVPPGYKILGGGARVNWTGAGSLLTAAYPKNKTTWFASAKDHTVSSPASITAYAFALYDPDDLWLHTISYNRNDGEVPHPHMEITLPDGFTLTGGGAYLPKSLLTASYPSASNKWMVRGKDHIVSSPGLAYAYAIGIVLKSGKTKLKNKINYSTGDVTAHPAAHVELDPGWQLSGGGAWDHWHGDGNLLTASSPTPSGWDASGKDHVKSSPASVTAYVIGLKEF